MSTHPEPELVSLLRQDGVRIRRTGPSQYWAPCPFHDDTRPSFQVRLSRRGYWRFKCWSTACGQQGNTSDYRRLTKREQERSPFTAADPTSERPRYGPVSADLHARAMEHYNQQLLQYPEAVAYLESRGIDPELAQTWGIGYAPGDSLYRILSRELTEQELDTCPLLYHRRREDRASRRIVIPHHDDRSTHHWHTARAIDPDRQRPYMSLPGNRPALLFLRQAGHRATDYIIVTEGPFDLMATLAAGYPGAATAGNPHPETLPRAIQAAGYRQVYILPDNDAGGVGWAEIVTQAAHQASTSPIVLSLPETYADPAETLLQRRPSPRTVYGTMLRVATFQHQPSPTPTADSGPHTNTKEAIIMAEYFGAGIKFFGNLTRDPEDITNRERERPVTTAKFSVAKNFHRYSTEEQRNVEDKVFYNCIAFGVAADQILKRKSGQLVWVEGEHQPREFTGSDGVPRISQDVRITDVNVYLMFDNPTPGGSGEYQSQRAQGGQQGNQGGQQGNQGGQQGNAPPAAPAGDEPFDIDDLPF